MRFCICFFFFFVAISLGDRKVAFPVVQYLMSGVLRFLMLVSKEKREMYLIVM